MNEFLKLLLFNQNYNFTHHKKYSIRKNIISLFLLNFKKKNLFSIILEIREILFKLISIIYIIPGFVLYFFNFKFACVNPYSVGTYAEELEAILVNNIKTKKKIILLEPSSYSANPFFVDIIFKNCFTKITSNLYCIILIPFTYLNFLRVDAYDKINKIYFQRQCYYLNNEIKDKIKFDHNVLFEKRSLSAENNIFNFTKLKDSNKSILDQINLKKICFLHIRSEKKLELRNGEFKNYIETINYLIENGFDVVFFSESNPKLDLKGFHFFDLKNNENKKKQIYYLIKSQIYLGNISGPFCLANFLEKKMIITDLVIFNHLLYSKNFVVITKKYLKNGNQLNLKNIFHEKLECIWDSNILTSNNIKFLNNSSNEILEASKELLNKENIRDEIDIQRYFNENNIKLKYSNFSILRGLSNYYLKNNKLIS